MKNNYFTLEDDFEKIIKNSLPNTEIINLKFISTGWTNIVYEAETTSGSFFFRFPRDEFWSRTIIKDYEFGKYIHQKTDFNTIKLQILYDKGRPFSMHKKIPGIPLAEKMNSLLKAEIDCISDQIANFMHQLHSMDYQKDAIFNTKDIGLNLNEFLDELLEVHVSDTDKKFWNKNLLSGSKNCLVHGDLNSSNILLDENNNVTAIIDFGFGGFGDKYDDIGRIIGRCPAEFKQAIINKYEKYSNEQIDHICLDNSINTWNKIDSGYINYMKKIGIYKE